MIFVVHGALTVDGGQRFADGEAWHGDGAVMLDAGEAGATCWRFELAASGADDGAAAGQGVSSRAKISAALDTLPEGDLILRGDSVAARRLRLSSPTSQ